MPISAIASGPLSTTPAAEHSTQKSQQQRQAEYRRCTYIVVAYIVVAYIVMAEYRRCTYIVVAYIVMAEYRRCRPKAPRLWVPTAAAGGFTSSGARQTCPCRCWYTSRKRTAVAGDFKDMCIDICVHVCVEPCVDMFAHMCAGVCADVCVQLRSEHDVDGPIARANEVLTPIMP